MFPKPIQFKKISVIYPSKVCFQDFTQSWPHADIRRHINDFLFKTNEEVNNLIANLSGGERARLSLALIAAKTTKLLILDEITNNLDYETKDHIIQVLREYPGTIYNFT